MIIVPVPWKRSEIEDMQDRFDEFDLQMNYSTQQCYIVIQDNTVTWVAQGTVPGKTAYQIKTRSTTMNGKSEIPSNPGNVGLGGTYSSIEDALTKLFPRNGFAVSNMQLVKYTGQSIKGTKDHFNIIEPIFAVFGSNPQSDLQHFFDLIGWGNRKKFSCSGTWSNMTLYVDNQPVDSFEQWFSNYCAIALHSESVYSAIENENSAATSPNYASNSTESKSGHSLGDIMAWLFWIIVLVLIFKSCS